VIWALAFSPDSSLLVADLGSPVLWDVRTRQVKAILAGTGGQRCSSLAFSADGARLVATHIDGVARVWDVQSQVVLRGPPRHNDLVLGADFSPDGQALAITRGRVVTVEMLYARPRPACRELHGHLQKDLTALAFSPDGLRLASLSKSGEVLLWETRSGQRPKRLSASPAKGPWNSLAFYPDTDRPWLWAGGDRLVCWKDGERERDSRIQKTAVRGLVFIGQAANRRLVSADGTGMVTLWYPEYTVS
jgi:WD40 repeat protein